MKSMLWSKDQGRFQVHYQRVGTNLWIHVRGETFLVDLKPKPKKRAGTKDTDVEDNQVVAPMPGKILRVLVKAGERVEKNQTLIVMEAMKMEYSLSAPCAGEVEFIDATDAQQVELNRVLARIKK